MIVLALFGVAPWARADFADGVRAYDGGDYAAVLAEWRPLAEGGDAEAQTALGGLYLTGQGVARDAAEAARWYARAARQGHADAQLNLGDLYALGFGVERDLVRALAWLGLAAAQGRTWAAARRDDLARALRVDELIAADHLGQRLAAEIETRAGGVRVISGDVIVLDGRTYRLRGVRAPELGETCRIGTRTIDCGNVARTALADLVAGADIACRGAGSRALCTANGYDLSEGMLHTGWALPDTGAPGERYRSVAAEARAKGRGLWRTDYQSQTPRP